MFEISRNKLRVSLRLSVLDAVKVKCLLLCPNFSDSVYEFQCVDHSPPLRKVNLE